MTPGENWFVEVGADMDSKARGEIPGGVGRWAWVFVAGEADCCWDW